MSANERRLRDDLARVQCEVTALREERQRLRRLAAAWRTANAASTFTGAADAVKARRAAVRAHEIAVEIVDILDAKDGAP